MQCRQLHCSLGNPEQSFKELCCVIQFSGVHSRAIQYSLVQFHLETCNAVRCRSVWWGAVQCSQAKTVQRSAVLSRQVQYSPLTCSPVQSSPCSPVHFSPVQSIQQCPVRSRQLPSNSVKPRPIPFSPFQLNAFQFGIAQVHYKSTAVDSSPVKCSAKQ